MKPTHHHRWLWLILIAAFFLRLGFAIQWQNRASAEEELFRVGDSLSYWVLGSHIAKGEPYHYGSENAAIFRAPLLPMLLAPATLLKDPQAGVLLARVCGCILGTLAVLQSFWLGSRLAGTNTGLISAALLTIYPSAIGMSVLILSEMLFIPLMLAHLLVWQRCWEVSKSNPRRAWWLGLLAGFIAGLAVLTRPSWLLFTPFACAVGMLVGPNRIQHLKIALLTVVGISIVCLPWWIRNATITGRFVPTTLQVGPSLYDGLHEGATGASDEGMSFMQEITQRQIEADQLSNAPLESTLEYRINQRATQEALQWAQENPMQVAMLALRKFFRTWSPWPDGGELGSFTTRLIISIASFGILLLALVGSIKKLPSLGWVASICWAPCLYFTVLHMVFVGSVRYREPALIALVSLAAAGIATLLASRFRSSSA